MYNIKQITYAIRSTMEPAKHEKPIWFTVHQKIVSMNMTVWQTT